MEKEKAYLDMLIQSLKLVAAKAETQTQQLPDWVHIPDEVALTFEDCYLLFPQVIRAGLVTAEQAEAVQRVDCIFDEMSNDQQIWTLEAMHKHPKWVEVRAAAKEALKKLGQPADRPKLGWLKYVPGGR